MDNRGCIPEKGPPHVVVPGTDPEGQFFPAQGCRKKQTAHICLNHDDRKEICQDEIYHYFGLDILPQVSIMELLSNLRDYEQREDSYS